MVNISKIKSLANEKGMSLTFICSKLGVARVYFNDLVKHKRDIPEERLAIIANILNTTPEYLRDETDQKEKPTETGEIQAAYDHAPDEIKAAIRKLLDL